MSIGLVTLNLNDAVDLKEAKIIGHIIRRDIRTCYFYPLDEIISKQLPGYDLVEVEEQRQAIRDKYQTIQEGIDNATTVQEIKDLLEIK